MLRRMGGDLLLAVVAIAVFAGSLAFQRGEPVARVVSARPIPKSIPRPPTQTAANPYVSTVAEAVIAEVPVFDSPDAPKPARTLDNPQPSGAPLVFLVKQLGDPWINVYLPVRP